MATTAGVLTLVSKTATTVKASATEATGGTAPYTHQWYRSTDPAFTPGGGNIVTGQTTLALTDSGLIPGTQYYYKLIYTDAGSVSATSTALSVMTAAPSPNPNQFAQSPILGQMDLRFPYNTVSVQIDASQANPLYSGNAVKIVDSADGVPKVIGVAANSDEVMGFINYNIKDAVFLPGMGAEISMAGNVVFLYATSAISRGAQVQLDITTVGGVTAKVGSSGADIVGWAYDKASAPGQLIRVFLQTPSFAKA